MTDLSGIWVALTTPFLPPATPDAPPAVDHPALHHLVRHLCEAGVHGLVALGSTGEAAALDDAEQDAMLRTVLEAAGDTPVMAGISGLHVGHMQARLRAFNALPLAAVLAAAPCYTRPSQAGLVAHFQALADASRAPLVLYDIPYRTGVALSLDTLLTLATHPRIIGLKDCGGSSEQSQQLIADGRLQVLTGEDSQVFPHLCLGAAGAISAAVQVAPRAYMDLYHAMRTGDWPRARAWHHRLAPLVRALFAEPNPCVIKGVLTRQGIGHPTVRAPLLDARTESVDAAWRLWTDLPR